MRTYIVKDKRTGEILASCINVQFALRILNQDIANRICLILVDNRIVERVV